jgi:hypothetical protein
MSCLALRTGDCADDVKQAIANKIISLAKAGERNPDVLCEQVWIAMARVTKLVLTFPDGQTAQQFSGWLFLEGYPDRILEQNTVTVEVPYDERDNVIEEAESRNGRVERE